MDPKASLVELMEWFGSAPENGLFYFDRQTGDVVGVEMPILKAVKAGNDDALANLPDELSDEPELAREILNDDGKRFVQLPDTSQWSDEQLQAGFIDTVHDEGIAEKLTRGMKRERGFFGTITFATVVYGLGLDDDWHKFRTETMKRIAIEWAEANSVPYEDDVAAGDTEAWRQA